MKCLYLLLIFSAVLARAYGQISTQYNIDSLERCLPKAREDTGKVWMLHYIAVSYSGFKPDEGIRYGKMELSLANKLHWKRGIAKAENDIGVNFAQKSEQAIALGYYFDALKVYEEIDDTIYYCNDLIRIGNVYIEIGEYSKAAIYYFKSLRSAQRVSDKKLLAVNLTVIGELFQNENKYDSALVYDMKAASVSEALGNKIVLATDYEDIGKVYSSRASYEKSNQYTEKGFRLFREANNKFGQVTTGYTLGYNFYMMAFDTTSGMRLKAGRGKQDCIKASERYLKACFDSAKIINNNEYLQLSADLLAKIGAATGHFEDAYRYANQYARIRDAISLNENKIQIANLETKRELQLKDKQIEIDRLEVNKKRNEGVFYITGLCLLMVVAGMAIIGYRRKNKDNIIIHGLVNSQEQTIAERTTQLAYANAKLVELIKYNAHTMREPLARVMGAMNIREFMTDVEFFEEVWPQMQKAVTDLDNSIKEVVHVADDTVGLSG